MEQESELREEVAPAADRTPAPETPAAEAPAHAATPANREYQRLVRIALQQRGASGPGGEAHEPQQIGLSVNELQSAYQRGMRQAELRHRIALGMRFLILIPIIALAVYLSMGWRRISISYNAANEEITRLSEMMDARTHRLREYVPAGLQTADRNLMLARADLHATDVFQRFEGVRRWRQLLSGITRRALSRAADRSPETRARLQQNLNDIQVQERVYMRRFNTVVADYNRRISGPPQSLVRPLSGFPPRLPYFQPQD